MELLKKPKLSTVYIGLGSNLGDREANLHRAIEFLSIVHGVRMEEMAAISETLPVGPVPQGPYLNCAVRISTSLSPSELLGALREIERQLGRVRTDRWGPRVIDLDLLLFGDRVIRTDELTIPHPQMHLRSFVMDPLCSLSPDRVHPVLKRTMAELAERLGGGDYIRDHHRPQLISIAGLIGVGKTTLAEGLSRSWNCPLIREAYDTNPYLPAVCGGQKELALKSQLYFLHSRAAQLSRSQLEAGRIAISDYVFDQDPIFARRTLDPDSRGRYDTEHHRAAGEVCTPTVVIYLKDTSRRCLERIGRRNRPFETSITIEVLEWFSNAYEQLFSAWTKSPVIRLDASDFDCRDRGRVESLASEVRHYLSVESV